MEGVKLPVFTKHDTGAVTDNQKFMSGRRGKKIVAVREKFGELDQVHKTLSIHPLFRYTWIAMDSLVACQRNHPPLPQPILILSFFCC